MTANKLLLQQLNSITAENLILMQKIANLSELCEQHKSKYEQVQTEWKYKYHLQQQQYLTQIHSLQHQINTQQIAMDEMQQEINNLKQQSVIQMNKHQHEIRLYEQKLLGHFVTLKQIKREDIDRKQEIDALQNDLSQKDIEIAVLEQQLTVECEECDHIKGYSSSSTLKVPNKYCNRSNMSLLSESTILTENMPNNAKYYHYRSNTKTTRKYTENTRFKRPAPINVDISMYTLHDLAETNIMSNPVALDVTYGNFSNSTIGSAEHSPMVFPSIPLNTKQISYGEESGNSGYSGYYEEDEYSIVTDRGKSVTKTPMKTPTKTPSVSGNSNDKPSQLLHRNSIPLHHVEMRPVTKSRSAPIEHIYHDKQHNDRHHHKSKSHQSPIPKKGTINELIQKYVNRARYVDRHKVFNKYATNRNKAWKKWIKLLQSHNNDISDITSSVQIQTLIDFARMSLGNYGNWLMIKHCNRWVTYFAVMRDFNLFLFNHQYLPLTLYDITNSEYKSLSIAAIENVSKSDINPLEFYLEITDSKNRLKFRCQSIKDCQQWIAEINYQIHIVSDLCNNQSLKFQCVDKKRSIWIPIPPI